VLSLIVTRAPFRISLFGGGTDFEDYFKNYPSKILSFTFDKHIYVIAKIRDDNLIYLNYSRKEICSKISQINHDLIREVLRYFKINFGIEISIISDIPSKGSGLGSSSALTNALVLAVAKLLNKTLSQRQISEISVYIEIKILKKPIGIQDQYGTAFGGIKVINMKENKIEIKKVNNLKLKKIIENNSIIYDTRKNRKAEEILTKQKQTITKNIKQLNLINEISNNVIKNLNKIDVNFLIDKLNESWSIKKNLEKKISNIHIEKKIRFLRKKNFEGLKLCGAGKGGFIFAIKKVSNSVLNANMKSIKIDYDGVKTIFFDKKM